MIHLFPLRLAEGLHAGVIAGQYELVLCTDPYADPHAEMSENGPRFEHTTGGSQKQAAGGTFSDEWRSRCFRQKPEPCPCELMERAEEDYAF